MQRFVVLLLILLPLGLVPAKAAPVGPEYPGSFMGMVLRDPHYEWNTNPKYPNDANRDFFDEAGRNLAAAGVKWVRIEFRAEDGIAYNPNDPAQGLNLPAYDYFINVVAPRHGFKVIGLLATQLIKDPFYQDPELLEPAKAPVDSPSDGGRPYPDCLQFRYGCGTTKAMRIWLDHAFAIAARYGSNVAAYEVMNEQNRYLTQDHPGWGIDPVALATLHTKFYRIFKKTGAAAADQIMPLPWRNNQVPAWAAQVNIIIGGLHAGRCDDCANGAGMTDLAYLNAIYQSGAFQGFRTSYGAFPLDGVGYHPYPMEIYNFPDEVSAIEHLGLIPGRIEQVAAVIANNQDNHKLWITELGDRGDPGSQLAQQRQATFLRSAYWFLWRQRSLIENVLWFKYEDFAASDNTQNWGVVRLKPGTATEYDPMGKVLVYKQSYTAYQDMATNGLVTYSTYLPLMGQ